MHVLKVLSVVKWRISWRPLFIEVEGMELTRAFLMSHSVSSSWYTLFSHTLTHTLPPPPPHTHTVPPPHTHCSPHTHTLSPPPPTHTHTIPPPTHTHTHPSLSPFVHARNSFFTCYDGSTSIRIFFLI